MDRLSHLKVDKFFWNEEYNEVHKWIDSSYKNYVGAGRNPYHHWSEHHHKEAIAKEFGNYTLQYNVAYLHILADWLSHFSIAEVPKDKAEVIELLKSIGVY